MLVVAAVATAQEIPATLVLNGPALSKNRTLFNKEQDGSIGSAVGELTSQAEKILAAGKLYSVLDKKQIPPSGDKHDYMSQAPYFWPDTTKPDGLPYLHRDGERNPELSKLSDSSELSRVVVESETLALAFCFTGDEKYARHSALLIRTWFVDTKTRQNPNLNFGQGIPGRATGRSYGLIETRDLYRVIDSAILLQPSRSWTQADHRNLKRWFADFLQWMIDSPIGKDEADERNNHGTFYDVQVIAYSIFTGKPEQARKQITVTKERIGSQIEPDGKQPHELARTLSWNYTNMNLLGFFTIARLSESLGVDLWSYQTGDGRGIRKAFQWLLPFIEDEKAWSYKQIKPRTLGTTAVLLRTASRKFQNHKYRDLAQKINPNGEGSIDRLNN
jgi:hypothetical protein